MASSDGITSVPGAPLTVKITPSTPVDTPLPTPRAGSPTYPWPIRFKPISLGPANQPIAPPFPPPKGTKSKSLTEVELQEKILLPAEIAAIGERLKNEEPPLSLEQARQRRLSIKEVRKSSIDFIRARTRARTLSKAAEQGRQDPSLTMKENQPRARATTSSGSSSSTQSTFEAAVGERLRSSLERLEEDENNKD